MLKKILMSAILAMTFFAAVGAEAGLPPPNCSPCPWVR